jgi:hypothetical protein
MLTVSQLARLCGLSRTTRLAPALQQPRSSSIERSFLSMIVQPSHSFSREISPTGRSRTQIIGGRNHDLQSALSGGDAHRIP